MDAAHDCQAPRSTGVEREKGGNSPSRHRGTRVRGRRAAACSAAAAAMTSVLLVLAAGAMCLTHRPSWGGTSISNEAGETHPDEADGLGAMVGISASSSMWGLSPPSWAAPHSQRDRDRRRLVLRGQMPGRPPHIGGVNPPPGAKRPPGEPAMLNEYNKKPLEWIDLDNVQEGHLWIPVAVDRFDPTTTDPLVKMCQVNYAKYSAAPWLLPMGGLLSLNSGCAELGRDTVQIVRMSVLEQTLQEDPVVAEPTGFIFHETRCGSTLVANMLASVESNIMWSESTGPWKVMHTCPKCPKTQIVPWLKTVMRAMTRSARHEHFYFKFQSSEDIGAVTAAFPNVPWIFIFREPVEVMMSRLGAQRIGMAGMEKEVEARVVKGMAATPRLKQKQKLGKEATTAQQLANLCRKAIQAFEARPDMAMMVEYPHIPDAILETVLPQHFRVDVSPQDHERMINTTKIYSKVASFAKGSPDSKFTNDVATKHDAASVAVTEAAQKFLYPDFYKLQSMQTWAGASAQT